MSRRLDRAGHLELRQLREENNDGEPVDEAQHHRMRHQSDELAPSHQPDENLNDPHQHDGGEQVFDPVIGHQGHHDHGQSAGRARDHAGPPAEDRGDETDEERGVQTHQRVNPGDEGEGHRFGHQRQCDGQTGQKLDPQPRDAQGFCRGEAQIGRLDTIGKACQKSSGQGSPRSGDRVRGGRFIAATQKKPPPTVPNGSGQAFVVKKSRTVTHSPT